MKIINKNLYKGFKAKVKPKQKLILTNDAFIISNSPWLIGRKWTNNYYWRKR